MLCIFGYVHFAGKRNDVNVKKKQKHYNKLSNDYYYVTHAAEGVPFVFTNAVHDNLISQEMHNSRQFARFAECICNAVGQTKTFTNVSSVAIMCYLFVLLLKTANEIVSRPNSQPKATQFK